jgi:hypothetical protein
MAAAYLDLGIKIMLARDSSYASLFQIRGRRIAFQDRTFRSNAVMEGGY